MSRPRIVIVAAVARNGVIGDEGGLPWELPEELAHFYRLTVGHAVVMGSYTYGTIPDRICPLPGRRNVVLSRKCMEAPGAHVAPSLQHALELMKGEQSVFIAGGSSVYDEALDIADALVLTEIAQDFPGDTYFPKRWEFLKWRFTELSRVPQISASGIRFDVVRYERRARHWSDSIYWRPGRWDDLSTAPQDCTFVRGRTADGKLLEPMHYACGGGEEQPRFDGWFMPMKGRYEQGSGLYQVRPVAWQPLRALPDGPDCAMCPRLPADCCRKAGA